MPCTTFFLRLIKEHFEGVLGLRLDPKDSKKKNQKNTTIVFSIDISNHWKKTFNP